MRVGLEEESATRLGEKELTKGDQETPIVEQME